MKHAGRPTIYTKALGLKICHRIAEGESVRHICEDDKMPSGSSIFRWLLEDDKKVFWEQYAHARAIQAELMFEELLDIADDGSNDFMTITKGSHSYNIEDKEVTNRSKLRVDARKWYLSKVLPKKFGEKIDINTTVIPSPILGGIAKKDDIHKNNSGK